MKNTKIEWAHHTVNFWWGCVKVSPACQNCYAELLAKLFSRGKATWGVTGRRWIRHEAATRELYARDGALTGTGRRERVFVNSMSDTFEDRADLTAARESLWAGCNNVRNLDILLLTKRPENVMRMVPLAWHVEWPSHVWIGTTVENQDEIGGRIRALLLVPARVRFLSCEPLLGPVDLTRGGSLWTNGKNVVPSPAGFAAVNWVIVGGESGARARPLHPAWARLLREQCRSAGVPFFFKQWGEWLPACQYPGADRAHFTEKAQHTFDPDTHAFWVGKKSAGRLLDGREHSEVPEVAA